MKLLACLAAALTLTLSAMAPTPALAAKHHAKTGLHTKAAKAPAAHKAALKAAHKAALKHKHHKAKKHAAKSAAKVAKKARSRVH